MTTREAAIKAAGECFAEAYLILDDPRTPVEEVARRAYTPTGPSMDELVERIRARRERTQTPAPAVPSSTPRRARGTKRPA